MAPWYAELDGWKQQQKEIAEREAKLVAFLETIKIDAKTAAKIRKGECAWKM